MKKNNVIKLWIQINQFSINVQPVNLFLLLFLLKLTFFGSLGSCQIRGLGGVNFLL